ncbi:hypothetical protein GCM10023231_25170 [Olivibacter ginsenosidimutans]|uniref:Transposase n=1 Tax=Olivibacter ginsenosidimutans TaxID=1176537 RepID=A0ABP9BHS6_9SPHI
MAEERPINPGGAHNTIKGKHVMNNRFYTQRAFTYKTKFDNRLAKCAVILNALEKGVFIVLPKNWTTA